MNDEQMKALAERNMQRAKEAIKKMGTKYVCHPANKITKAKWKQTLRKSKRAMLNY